MMYGKMTKLTVNDQPIKFEAISWPTSDLDFVDAQKFTVKAISNMYQIPASLMTGECLMNVDLTESGKAWLEKETEKIRRRLDERLLADLRRLERFLAPDRSPIEDVIIGLESRRWAADYTKQFFRGRPGIRLADALNVARN